MKNNNEKKKNHDNISIGSRRNVPLETKSVSLVIQEFLKRNPHLHNKRIKIDYFSWSNTGKGQGSSLYQRIFIPGLRNRNRNYQRYFGVTEVSQ